MAGILKFKAMAWLVLLLVTSAPSVAAADFVDFTPSDRLVEVDAHAIGGASSVMQNYKSCFPQIQNLNVNMGASLGIGARAVFGLRGYLGFGTAIDVTLNNYNVDMAVMGTDRASMSAVFIDNHTYKVNVPVFVSFRFNVDRSVRWNVDVGVYYSYGFAGTQKQNIYRADINEMEELVSQKLNVKTDYYHSENTFINSFNRGDIGLHVATSLNFGPHLLVGVRAQTGLKNSARPNGVRNPMIRNYDFHAVLGYRF